ncbi:uncharacterized protein LOC122265726 [Penaeus japonicus]|uniref:uncharacterized protein LOC122265726 n=1 Tax=Penaeus japonicus TaxID=27405 RepID=UPI001C70EDA2|nr:uncharacterized protein LOC122265726 [Penaeus japonicus]
MGVVENKPSAAGGVVQNEPSAARGVVEIEPSAARGVVKIEPSAARGIDEIEPSAAMGVVEIQRSAARGVDARVIVMPLDGSPRDAEQQSGAIRKSVRAKTNMPFKRDLVFTPLDDASPGDAEQQCCGTAFRCDHDLPDGLLEFRVVTPLPGPSSSDSEESQSEWEEVGGEGDEDEDEDDEDHYFSIRDKADTYVSAKCYLLEILVHLSYNL